MRIRVKDVGKVGIIKDRQPIELPPNAWSDGNNMMFRSGFAESRRGVRKIFDEIKGSADFIMPFDKGTIDFIYAGNKAIYTFPHDATLVVDITERTRSAGAGGSYSAANRWVGTVHGNIPILSKPSVTPQFLSDGADTFEDLRNLPANFKAKIIVSFKNYLMAFSVDEGSGLVENLVRWSSLSDPNTLPTSWDYTDTSVDAGRTQVGETTDPIVNVMRLKDTLFIYRARSVWRCDFVGGNFVFKFQEVYSVGSASGIYAIGGDENRHFVFTNDMDLLMHDGVSARSMLDDVNKEFIRSTMDKSRLSHVVVYYDPNRDEVILGYPNTSFLGAETALVFNVSQGTYAFRDMHSTSMLAYGKYQINETSLEHWWSENADTGNVNEYRNLMAGGDLIYVDDYLYNDDLGAGITHISSHLVREDFPFHQYGIDDNRIIEIKAIYPHIEAVGASNENINIYVIRKDFLDQKISDAGVKQGPFTFRAGFDYKVDLRVACRYPGFIFEVNNASYQWRITGYDIEFDVAGYQ